MRESKFFKFQIDEKYLQLNLPQNNTATAIGYFLKDIFVVTAVTIIYKINQWNFVFKTIKWIPVPNSLFI